MIVPTVVAFAQGFHEATCLSLTLGHELRSTESNISVLPFNQLGQNLWFCRRWGSTGFASISGCGKTTSFAGFGYEGFIGFLLCNCLGYRQVINLARHG